MLIVRMGAFHRRPRNPPSPFLCFSPDVQTFLLYNIRFSTSKGASTTTGPIMTRHSEPRGPPTLLQVPLPVRPAPDVPLTANENNERHLQNAVNEGKNISALLADILKQSSLADNEESNLHQILLLAEQLHNYQSPVEFTIGLVGDSGVGMYNFYVEAMQLTFCR
jgi:hypothetical protein